MSPGSMQISVTVMYDHYYLSKRYNRSLGVINIEGIYSTKRIYLLHINVFVRANNHPSPEVIIILNPLIINLHQPNAHLTPTTSKSLQPKDYFYLYSESKWRMLKEYITL